MKTTISLLFGIIFGVSCYSPDSVEDRPSADGESSADSPALVALKPNNPIIPNRGVNDPHIRIIDGTAYLSATHDKSADNTTFIMEDWWLWSSDDLVDWELMSVLRPEDTYIEDESGVFYIVFGVWDFYIAELNDDMISMAEAPRKIEINNPRGPYNLDGQNPDNPTDDKPFLHYNDGYYYLSWGCFYAMADNIYGPYDYKGCIIEQESFAAGYDAPTWPNGFKQGRHGSFFQWHGQWYFTYCDISQTGNRYFRDSFISYVHYRENGEIAPIRVDGTGVGQYDASNGSIEAEDFFAASGISKRENIDGGFFAANIDDGDFLTFPNVHGLDRKTRIEFKAADLKGVTIEIHDGSPEGEILVSYELENQGSGVFGFDFPAQKGVKDLGFVFRGEEEDLLLFDSFSFK